MYLWLSCFLHHQSMWALCEINSNRMFSSSVRLGHNNGLCSSYLLQLKHVWDFLFGQYNPTCPLFKQKRHFISPLQNFEVCPLSKHLKHMIRLFSRADFWSKFDKLVGWFRNFLFDKNVFITFAFLCFDRNGQVIRVCPLCLHSQHRIWGQCFIQCPHPPHHLQYNMICLWKSGVIQIRRYASIPQKNHLTKNNGPNNEFNY